MAVDGVRPAPGPKPPEPDADLPSGPEVPPGNYRITIDLDGTSDSVDVTTAADPRSRVTQQGMEAKFATMLELRSMRETFVEALERIDRARSDTGTIEALMARPGSEAETEDLKAQAKAVQERLDDLERQFRTPPETTGIVYEADQVGARLGMATWYVGSSPDAPSATARAYVDDARRTLDAALGELNGFLAGELSEFRRAVEAAGLGLLSGMEPVGG
jgi:hypothetical protein